MLKNNNYCYIIWLQKEKGNVKSYEKRGGRNERLFW